MDQALKQNNTPKRLLIASPRGFCAGVKRAVEILNQVLNKFPNQTVYCYHQIVHNTFVVADFEAKGVRFVDDLSKIPSGSILVLSAHGVSPEIKKQAQGKNLKVFDATCPYVEKTHQEIIRFARLGYIIVYIGKMGHDEVVGATKEAPDKIKIIQTLEDVENLQIPHPDKVALVTQTTLSLDETQAIKQALKEKFPKLVEPLVQDICSATQNRQNGVKEIVKKGAQIVIVLGSPNSSNSNKLKGVAEKAGAKGWLVDDVSDINPAELHGFNCLGLTAGASLPENKIQQAIDWFKAQGVGKVAEVIVADESKQN